MGKLTSYAKLIKLTIIIIAVLSLGIFIINTDFTTLKHELDKVGLKFIYILLLTFTAYFLGAIGWQVCLGSEKEKISILQLFAVRQIGETLAIYNPTSIVAGDLLKAKLLHTYHIQEETALQSVIASRITATLSQITLFLIAITWLLYTTGYHHIPEVLKFLIPVAVGILLSLIVALFFWLSSPLHDKPIRREGSVWQKAKSSISINLYNSRLFFQRERKLFWNSYLFFTLHWVVGSMEFYLLLSFMGYPIQLMHGLVLDMSVIVIKSIGAAIPGQIGIEEFGNKITLYMIGVKSTTLWISISILRRMRQLVWTGIGLLLTICLKKRTMRLDYKQTETSPTLAEHKY